MTNKCFRCAWALVLASMWAGPVRADTLFYSVSGDPNNGNVPDVLSSVDSDEQTVTGIGAMGGGNLGFNGGLTVVGGQLYGIANDFLGNSSFYKIGADGSRSLIGSAGGLGQGFLGGVAWDTENSSFYAAVLDSEGNTSLASISQTGQAAVVGNDLGSGFSGLAFDSANGLFYGIANDGTGFSTLVDFALNGPVNDVGSLGFGFGALTYDAANNVFWALAPVDNAGTTLHEITALGEESDGIFTLGDGFDELAVRAPAVPEPATEAELSIGLCLLTMFLKRKRA